MTTPYQDRKIPAPMLNTGDEPYFEAAAQGKLMTKYCKACKQYHHYPRAMCPHCHSFDTEWRQAKGTGTIYSFSITRATGPTAYAVAYVTLDEGPTMLTNIVDCDLDTIRIGQKVSIRFKPTEDAALPVPMFVPI